MARTHGSEDDTGLAVHLVRMAGALAATYAGRPIEVTMKAGPGDLVTEADLAVEAAMVWLLREHRPDDGILGEEGSFVSGSRTWVLDPIDGTENFVSGDGYWCSAVALTDTTGTLVSAVHHSATGDTYWAARGAGAWWNGRRLRVAAERSLATTRLATFLDTGGEDLPVLAAVIREVASTRMRGSGTLELAWLARGIVDAWLQRDVHEWDWLPGALLVKEAGGCVDRFPVPGGTWFLACSPGTRRRLLDLLDGGGHRSAGLPAVPLGGNGRTE